MEKLVRHHSPEQLEAQGEKVEWRLAKLEEMPKLLRDKIVEEVEELCEAIDANSRVQMIEELADVAQVVAALRNHLGAEDVDDKIREKFFDRGDFGHGVVMTIAPAVPMILHCPKCSEKHVDRGVFGTTHVHRTHLCTGCGHIWKPFNYATVGVEDVAVYKLAGSGGTIGGAAADPTVHVAEIQAWLRERTDKLKADVKIEMFAFFDRLRKTITLNRGQFAEVLANSILVQLDLESQE